MMNTDIHAEEHLEMEAQGQATGTETDLLAQSGLSAEEIVALLWLRQFVTYEKELRPADEKLHSPDDSTEMLIGV